MKKTFIVAALLFCLPAAGQQVRFSPDLKDSTDADTKALTELWSNYVASYNDPAAAVEPRSFRLDGCDDMLAYSTGGQMPIYCFGEQNVVGIRKVAGDYFEIAVEYNMPYWDWEHWTLCHFYKVYAAKTADGFKLLNYFDVAKLSMTCYSTPIADFYSAGTISKKRIAALFKSFDTICATYSLTPKHRIVYIMAESIDECWNRLGVPYTVYRSESPFAAFTMPPATILATVPDKLHELVHALFLPYYPSAPLLVHEGLATYYGGSAGNDFETLSAKLKDWLEQNDIDWSNEEVLNEHFCKSVPLSYAIGAVIVDCALRDFGTDKVLQLLECKNDGEVFESMGIPTAERTEWLRNRL